MIEPFCIDKISVPKVVSLAELRRRLESCDCGMAAISIGCGWDEIEQGEYSLERMVNVLSSTEAVMVYSDFDDLKEGARISHPLTDYQYGSVRDDFDFGAVVMMSVADAFVSLRDAEEEYGPDGLQYGAFYALRLGLSRYGEIIHIRERLYAKKEKDLRLSGEKQFDYVNPANREVQVEMERVCTAHLKKTGCYLPARSRKAGSGSSDFKLTASVVIPVRNRVGTIADAVSSALNQVADFSFNVIVVDNHSDDGTSELLEKMAEAEPRLVHIVPERDDLLIGGCWNQAVFDERCGHYAVQLDSDDVYSSSRSLHIIVDKLRCESLAMAVGSYQLTDFDLKPIPPGVIDHREWTDENGHNNALRINGLGAPRAFDAGILREIGGFPNVSYGEDYAVGIRITREYRLGRIFDVLYNCRRWSGNSDSALSQEKINRNNEYKDMLRTIEMKARKNMNEKGFGDE